MYYDIIFGKQFKKNIKKLKKRYPSVKKDITFAVEILSENPYLGALIPGGLGVRKLRIQNSDVRKGKSGGYRMLYYLEDKASKKIYLLLLYSKSDLENVSSETIQRLLTEI